jgi:hypothetical protein
MSVEYSESIKLSEAEVVTVCQFAGTAGEFDEPYEQIGTGSEIVFWTEGNEYHKAVAIKLSLGKVAAAQCQIDDIVDNPNSKIFEGKVLRTTSAEHEFMIEEEVIGILFPNGFGSIVDHADNDDFLDRRIAAAAILFEANTQS